MAKFSVAGGATRPPDSGRWVEQVVTYFGAMKRRACRLSMVMFPPDGHGFLRRSNYLLFVAKETQNFTEFSCKFSVVS